MSRHWSWKVEQWAPFLTHGYNVQLDGNSSKFFRYYIHAGNNMGGGEEALMGKQVRDKASNLLKDEAISTMGLAVYNQSNTNSHCSNG